MKYVILKIGGGAHEVILEVAPFFIEQATSLLSFFFNSIWWSCVPPSPCTKGKKKRNKTENPSNWALYVEKNWLLHFCSSIWATHWTASQNKQCQSNKNCTYMEYEDFTWYIGPHDSGHHPTLVYMFLCM